jgi:hypothetical protein
MSFMILRPGHYVVGPVRARPAGTGVTIGPDDPGFAWRASSTAWLIAPPSQAATAAALASSVDDISRATIVDEPGPAEQTSTQQQRAIAGGLPTGALAAAD